jgi:hypothetical protein
MGDAARTAFTVDRHSGIPIRGGIPRRKELP